MKKIFYLLFIVYSVALGQPKEEIILKNIEVEGNTITSETMIRYTAGLRAEDKISPGDFSRAVKRLWQLGLFRDIQIRMDNESTQGLDITIVVQENYILGDVDYIGNKK